MNTSMASHLQNKTQGTEWSQVPTVVREAERDQQKGGDDFVDVGSRRNNERFTLWNHFNMTSRGGECLLYDSANHPITKEKKEELI